MTVEVLKNNRVTLYFQANGYANCSGNSTTCDIYAPNDNSVNSAAITQIWWGIANATGNITVARGANVILTLTGTGWMQFAERGAALIAGNTAANTVVTFNTGATTGFCRVELQKQTSINLALG